MRRVLWPAVLASCACAGWRAPAPGPTPAGAAFAVKSRTRDAARREALEEALPLFASASALAARAEAVEREVHGRAGALVGRERGVKAGRGVVEVRADRLAAAVRAAGVVPPPGYETGGRPGLLALGERGAPPAPLDRAAAEALSTALFGRGLQAHDADDPLLPMRRPLKAREEAGLAEEAFAGGWAWLLAGRASGAARPDPGSGTWRGSARLSLALSLAPGEEPARWEAEGTAVDVSSGAALGRAAEQAAQLAAVRVDKALERRRAGRATLAALTAAKDPAFLRLLVVALRAVEGVDEASLALWDAGDGIAAVHVYARGLGAETLAARLLGGGAPLRVVGVETEDGRVVVEPGDGKVPEAARD